MEYQLDLEAKKIYFWPPSRLAALNNCVSLRCLLKSTVAWLHCRYQSYWLVLVLTIISISQFTFTVQERGEREERTWRLRRSNNQPDWRISSTTPHSSSVRNNSIDKHTYIHLKLNTRAVLAFALIPPPTTTTQPDLT